MRAITVCIWISRVGCVLSVFSFFGFLAWHSIDITSVKGESGLLVLYIYLALAASATVFLILFLITALLRMRYKRPLGCFEIVADIGIALLTAIFSAGFWIILWGSGF